MSKVGRVILATLASIPLPLMPSGPASVNAAIIAALGESLPSSVSSSSSAGGRDLQEKVAVVVVRPAYIRDPPAQGGG